MGRIHKTTSDGIQQFRDKLNSTVDATVNFWHILKEFSMPTFLSFFFFLHISLKRLHKRYFILFSKNYALVAHATCSISLWQNMQ